MQNSNCYIFEKRNYKNGFLDSFVDATYILTMIDSNRKDNYENQLKEFIPTKIVYIVYNKGYKKCNKILIEKIPPYDLIDSYLNTINHSINNNYNNILILEDDFIFDVKIKDKKIINEIENLFNNNNNKSIYFNLGPSPNIFYPNFFSNSNIYRGISAILSHSIIYNKKILHNIINDKNIYNYLHIDKYLRSNYENYFYKIPLSYQTFPNTENKKYWFSKETNNLFNIYYHKIFNYMIDKIEINTNPILGWNRLYNILFLLNYLIFTILIIFLIIFLIFIIYYIIKFFKHKNKNNKK